MKMPDPIDSRMIASYRESIQRPREEVGFYLVASNRELLNHVEDLMNQLGVFGVMDQSGRVHYLLDGRKGSPYALRKIMTTTDKLLENKRERQQGRKTLIRKAVDQVMDRYAWNKHLRGYRLLGEMLRLAVYDESLLNPISKRLYTELAQMCELQASQVERNVRYLLDDLARRETRGEEGTACRLLLEGQTKMPVGRTIARLVDEVRECLEIGEEEAKAGGPPFA